ncbi:phage tail tape measure protein [Ketogulonicigenium vulgare]|uniref:phage tail tape measure protein n=1 Tax=Ketogulonicigenium vulgare TaxID=92945 RepID=UPI002359E289|nr:hypothetical protein [Ketogulonicigenium vulgare]
MADETQGLIIRLEARTRDLERGLQRANAAQRKAATQMEARAKQSADKMAASYARVPDGIMSMFSTLKTIALPAIGVKALTDFARNVRNTTREVAELSNQAERAGVSTTVFQEWAHVANVNRISIDALTDGFKELHLRAGEFFLDGTGAGAEAFKKLGYSADQLKEKLQDPSALMVEILGRLGQFDQAGRSFLLEEIFGGAGGEQFSALIGQGENALRQTIQAAHDTGAVLDAELILRAEELDRKFTELTSTVGNFGKKAAVAIAEAAVGALTLKSQLDQVFGGEDQGRAILGDQVYDAIANNGTLLAEEADNAEVLTSQFAALGDEAHALASALLMVTPTLRAWEYEAQGTAIASAAEEMRALAASFQAGEIDADSFLTRMAELQSIATDAFAALEEGDRIEFGGVMSQLSRLGGILAGVTTEAQRLTEALEVAAGVTPEQTALAAVAARTDSLRGLLGASQDQADANQRFADAEAARNTATTEQLRLEREIEAVRKRASEAGATMTDAQARDAAVASLAGADARLEQDRLDRAADRPDAGGKTDRLEGFVREAQAIRDRTTELQIEAQVVAGLTAAQRGLADASAFAEAKTKMLVAAQAEGRAITPDLEADIDRLATAYSAAGAAAAQAADDMAGIEERGKKGAEALADAFGSVLDGSKSAKEAIADLLIEMAKMQAQKALLGMFEGTPLATAVGGMLGFAGGGFTGRGGKFQPAGVVHKGEFVFSQEATSRLGADNLARLHRNARRGFSAGGAVDLPAMATRAASDSHRVAAGASGAGITINSPITVNATGGTPEQNADLARQVSEQHEAAMRALMRDEMAKQTRYGGILAR